MALVLDTSILVDIERKRNETVKKLEEISKNHFLPPRITFINYFEFYEGIIEKNIVWHVRKSQIRLFEFVPLLFP